MPKPVKADPVNPAHYQGDAVMVFIEKFNLGFCLGNVVKYVARSPNKGATLRDLEKAEWYLKRAIENLALGGTAESPQAKEAINGDSVQVNHRRIIGPKHRVRWNDRGSSKGVNKRS